MDFTLNIYHRLLEDLLSQGFTFQAFGTFMQTPASRVIILRHDVDRRPGNALKTALLEQKFGIPASYYFRAVPESWDAAVIKKIAGMGHEIGYHYENLSACKGDPALAWKDFQANLAKLRDLAPVTTICMHGSPISRYDNRELWRFYDYRDLGIVGEPYFDVDYSKVFYITDTGRKWNNEAASIRDRVVSGFDITIRNTRHLAEMARRGELPDQVMITAHPQRWHDRPLPWMKELVWQNAKNVVKKVLGKRLTQRR